MTHPYQMARQRADHSHATADPDMPSTRITWNGDEQRKVAVESYRLLQADKSLSNMAAIEQAQKNVLLPKRRRDLAKTAFAKFRPWIPEMWAKLSLESAAPTRPSDAPLASSHASPHASLTVVPDAAAKSVPSNTSAPRTLVHWTGAEQCQLAARVSHLTHAFEDMSRLDALRKAIESELPASRHRELKAWSQVSAWLDPMLEQCAHEAQAKQVEARREQERQTQEREAQAARRRGEEARIESEVQRRVDTYLAEHEHQTHNVSLDGVVQLFANRLANVMMDAFSSAFSNALATQLSTANKASLPAFAPLEDKPPAPPKDRLPRVTVVGLLNQQAEDVKQAFLGTVDFVFVKSQMEGGGGHGGVGMLTKSATSDLVIAMVDHCGHDVDNNARRLKVPYQRLGGSVSALKRWLTEWLAAEAGVGQ
jgi:hypothetical protein